MLATLTHLIAFLCGAGMGGALVILLAMLLNPSAPGDHLSKRGGD